MIFAIAMGVLSAMVALIVVARLGIKKFMGYPAFMDVAVTVALAWLLHGSYVGMVAAIIGGLVFSAAITVIRKMYGYTKLERRGFKIVWVEHEPTWTAKIKSTILNTQQDLKEGTWKLPCLNLNLSRWSTVCIAGLLILASCL